MKLSQLDGTHKALHCFPRELAFIKTNCCLSSANENNLLLQRERGEWKEKASLPSGPKDCNAYLCGVIASSACFASWGCALCISSVSCCDSLCRLMF